MPEPLSIEFIFLIGSVLFLVSIAAGRLFSRFGVPSLLLFLAIGMLAGSEGIGGMAFDDAWIAKSLGVAALVLILFSGGLDTDWQSVRPVLWQGLMLSTLGVLLTALLTGAFLHFAFGIPMLPGLLVGSIVSSTDAAAVFSVLRSRSISLKGRLKPLLELESGSNDPMAVFLTVGLIQWIQNAHFDGVSLGLMFLRQMTLGFIFGALMSRVMVWTINRLKLEYEGLYPVLTLSFVLFTYGLCSIAGGNGFLAAYVCGLLMARHRFYVKKNLSHFHDGIAWLMQIAMFLSLGLLVYPSRVMAITGIGLLTSLFLIFIARPISVFIALLFSKLTVNEKHMVAWVGLRGAAPIVLATFALLAKVPESDTIFNIVFFIVLTSVLLQGTSIPVVAKFLKVDAPLQTRRRYPIEFEQTGTMDADLVELIVPYNAEVAGKQISELNLAPECLITLVCRGEKFMVASGKTRLEEGDVILALTNKANLKELQSAINQVKKSEPA